MSSSRCLLWCALLTAALDPPARGQNAAAYRSRLDSLQRRNVLVNRLLDRRRATLMQISPRDTIRSGGLTVVVPRSVGSQARALVDSAWTVLDSTYGNSTALLARRTFVLQFPNIMQVVLPGEITAASGTLIAAAARQIDQQVDTALTAWLVGVYSPVPLERIRWDLLYVGLATTPWSRVEGCYADRLDSCRLALGLDGRDDPIRRWYDAADRRRLVGTASGDSKAEELKRQCLLQESDAVCTDAFRALQPGSVTPPLGGGDRTSLLQLAITLGGRNAYDRLMASRGQPIAVRLGLAAGIPTDSLVREWRTRVISARPASVDLTVRSAWMSVTWCLILGLLALRSSRWR